MTLIVLRIGLNFEELVRIGYSDAADHLRMRLAPNGIIYGTIR
jgi:hypothetical protein